MVYFNLRDYALTILFVILLFSLISFIFYLSYYRIKKLRNVGYTLRDIYRQPRLIFARLSDLPVSSPFFFAQDKVEKDIIPKPVDPYLFYCSHCDITSVGYDIFCPICRERMRQPSLEVLESVNKEKISCVICHIDNCPVCDRKMTGNNSCLEECPYCESKYHKHCWNKTMEQFDNKCGHCLEIVNLEKPEKLDLSEIREELNEKDIMALYEVETGKKAIWRGVTTKQYLKWKENNNL